MKHSDPDRRPRPLRSRADLAGCGGDSNGTTPTTPTPVGATLTAPKLDAPVGERAARYAAADADGAERHLGSADRVADLRVPDLRHDVVHRATTSSTSAASTRTVGKTGVAEGTGGKTSFTVESDLQPTTMFYWRARAIQGPSTGPWSDMFQFKSKLVGFNRAGELYDPLIHGETVGTIVGSATLRPRQGRRSLNNGAELRQLPAAADRHRAASSRWTSRGCGRTGPATRPRSSGMQEGQGDFIVNPLPRRHPVPRRRRVSRPTRSRSARSTATATISTCATSPTPARGSRSVFTAQSGDHLPLAGELGQRVPRHVRDGGEPDRRQRHAIYNVGMPSPKGSLLAERRTTRISGAPVGRSGAESASIGGAIYRNVCIGSQAAARHAGQRAAVAIGEQHRLRPAPGRHERLAQPVRHLRAADAERPDDGPGGLRQRSAQHRAPLQDVIQLEALIVRADRLHVEAAGLQHAPDRRAVEVPQVDRGQEQPPPSEQRARSSCRCPGSSRSAGRPA